MKERKELNATEREEVVISAYWPPRLTDELPIGYSGGSKSFIVLESIGLILTLASEIIRLPIGAKFLPLWRRLSWVRLSFTLFLILLTHLSRRQQKKAKGFYQLDMHGTPTHYIGPDSPVSIMGHVGLSRERFLQSPGS